MSGPELITLGCRLNIVESETMRVLAADQDDLIIINSCAVTSEAVKQARQAIRQAARRRPGARIVVTGCAAQIDPASFAAMPEVARVLGNGEKMRAERFAFEPGERADIVMSDVMALRETTPHMAAAFSTHARAFVEVQNGCDHRCTFCIIPFGRGNSRSVPAATVVDRIKALVDEGHQEVVLTGVDLTSYGADLPGGPTLGLLVERILTQVPALGRLRLSSLDSIEIDDRLFALLTGEQRIMPHVHLSLQAGDDLILKRMKRRHSRAQAVATVERLKAARSDVTIGADLIAGFPTESEEAALNSLKLLDDCDIIAAHIFPFSARPDTPAARMPQLERELVKARAARLRHAAQGRRSRWLDGLVGTCQTVLIENSEKGHSDGFAPLSIEGSRRGDLGRARVIGRDEDHLVGIFE